MAAEKLPTTVAGRVAAPGPRGPTTPATSSSTGPKCWPWSRSDARDRAGTSAAAPAGSAPPSRPGKSWPRHRPGDRPRPPRAAARLRLDAVYEGRHRGSRRRRWPPGRSTRPSAATCWNTFRDPLAFLRRLRSWLAARRARWSPASPTSATTTVVRSLLAGNWTYEIGRPAGPHPPAVLHSPRGRRSSSTAPAFASRGAWRSSRGPDHAEWVGAGSAERGEGRPAAHRRGCRRMRPRSFHAYQFLVTARPANRPNYGPLTVDRDSHLEPGGVHAAVRGTASAW